MAQVVTVVGSVAQELPGAFGTTDQARCTRTIVRLTAAQQVGKKTASSIHDCVDFRISSAARGTIACLCPPPLSPEAERRALTYVVSITCAALDRPRAESSRNNLSHTPRSAQRTKRL
jgi:hypothetical protein